MTVGDLKEMLRKYANNLIVVFPDSSKAKYRSLRGFSVVYLESEDGDTWEFNDGNEEDRPYSRHALVPYGVLSDI